MSDWTPWHFITFVGVLSAAVIVPICVAAWHVSTRRRIDLASLSLDERAARLLGEAIGQRNGCIRTETVDEVMRIFAGATSEQKRAIVAAIAGMFATATGGPANLVDLDEKVLTLARRLGGATDPATT
jgi:hypothetical protein